MVTCSNLKVLLQSLYIRTHLQLFFTTYNIAIHEMLVCLAKKNIFTSMIGFVTWPPFIIVYRYEKRWPSDKANHTCENML